MDTAPFLIPVLVNSTQFTDAQADSGCHCYAAVSEPFMQRCRLARVPLPERREVRTAVTTSRRGGRKFEKTSLITYTAKSVADIDGWESPVVAYVIPGLTRDLILGAPWMARHDVTLRAKQRELVVHSAGDLVIQATEARRVPHPTAAVMGSTFAALIRRETKARTGCQLVATSLYDITSVLRVGALSPAAATSPKSLPDEVEQFRELFDKEQASALPPHRGSHNHHIRLRKNPDGSDPELPWGPLYNMPRDHLLEVRKQITELMDKGWIRASSSAAAAPVLLAKKPGGGWRFCVDYRVLNKVTEQDRYPLPLVKETLRSLAGARWFTKLDVRAAFHKLRVAEGQEHLTAFRTRFGLFEYLVCPFGLAGAPATFQRYINGALGETLGDFTTAYLDDVLIYSSGSRKDHWEKVKVVLTKLQQAGLHLDLEKCEFAVEEVKYLGFIIHAGREVRPDPAKIAAIRDWEAPTRVKGVRSFLGFANFTAILSHVSQTLRPL